MKVSIQKSEGLKSYDIPLEDTVVLEALQYIKENLDTSLCFQRGCKSEICGCCAVMVDGKPVLACGTKVADGMTIQALSYHEIKRDLIVSKEFSKDLFHKTQAYLERCDETTLSSKTDEKRIELQSDCILCHSCYSVCPVLEVNRDFLGPFALTKVFRYAYEVKEKDQKTKIDLIQHNGIWDCTLCGECAVVCPQGISSKDDIIQLRIKSATLGYSDPKLSSFGGDFGFDPSGF